MVVTIKDKIITSPKDSVAVVTFGNPAKQTKECEFETVRQVIALSLPSSENILKLEDYTYGITGVNQFDEDYGYGDDSGVRLHEALWQCQTIVSRFKGKVASSTTEERYTRKIAQARLLPIFAEKQRLAF